MKRNTSITTLLTLPVLTGAFLASAAFTPVYASENNCDKNPDVDLQGTVSRNEAKVTNYSASCEYQASLAVYESPKQPETYRWIEEQKFLGSQTVTVRPGETVSLKVDYSSSACYFQSDLIRGGEENVIKGVPTYRTAMDTDVYSASCNNTSNNNSNNPTNNNTTNNVVTTVTEKLASTGDAVLVYAFILAGFATLAAGLFLKKASK